MEKLASQMLEKAKQFVASNPQIIKNTLLAGGLGAAAGAMIPSPAEDEDEPASARLKRRLKNALIGGTVAGGAGALLSNAAYNFGTAKLQRQMTPEEKFIEAQDDLAGTLKNPLTLLGGAAVGGGIGAAKDWKVQQDKANTIIKNINAKADAIEKSLQEQLKNTTDVNEIARLKTELQHLTGPADSMGTAGLRKWLYANKDAIENGATSGRGSILTALQKGFGFDSKPELAKAVRELNISAVNSGLETGYTKLFEKQRVLNNLLPRLKGNWRTAGLAAAVPLGLGITGAMVDPD